MAQLVLLVLAQTKPLARQPETLIPGHPPVAPILVPLARRVWMAEKLDLHLLEFTRAKREIPGRDLIPKTLANLPDAKRNFHARAVGHVLEVYKNPLSRLRPQE